MCESRKLHYVRKRQQLRLCTAVSVMHPFMRSAGIEVRVIGIGLSLRRMRLSVIVQCAGMADDLMQLSLAGDHRLHDQTQHQKRQEDLAAARADPAEVTAFHSREA